MTKVILQVNFDVNVSRGEFEKAAAPLAVVIANASGAIWKIWSINEDKKEVAGFYLFEDKSSAQRFVAGEIADAIRKHPTVNNLTMKQFEVMEDLTRVTRGPISSLTHN
jgi:hypothetical protein